MYIYIYIYIYGVNYYTELYKIESIFSKNHIDIGKNMCYRS